MTRKNFLSKGNERYAPLYLSLLKKKVKGEYEDKELTEKAVKGEDKELTEKAVKGEDKEPTEEAAKGKNKKLTEVMKSLSGKMDIDTVRRYWYSCDENGTKKGEKSVPLSFIKKVMKTIELSEDELWKMLKKELSFVDVLDHTFLFTEDERSNYEKPYSATYLADEWYGKAPSVRKNQFIRELLKQTDTDVNDNDVTQEIKNQQQIKYIIASLPVEDCYFVVTCHDLYMNISQDTETFIKTYLALDNKARKVLKNSFEKKTVKGEYLLETLGDVENMGQIALLLQLRNRVLEASNVLTDDITQEGIMKNADDIIYDDWTLAAFALYSQIDEDAYNLWLMYMLLDENSRRKKDREMAKLKEQKD